MSGANLNELRSAVALLRWAKQRKAEIKEIEDRAAEAVKAAMGDAELGMMDDQLVVTWKGYKRTALDQKALKEEHPEIAALYQKTTVVRRFEVLDE